MGDQIPTNSVTQIIITTDGACRGNPGPGGWSFIVVRLGPDGEEKVSRLSGAELATTNNRMELTAAVKALASLCGHLDVPIILRSDSQYLIKGMAEWMSRWIEKDWRTSGRKPVLNRDLWERLNDLAKSLTVQWTWLQGHAGDPHNEEADRLAKQAIDKLLAKAA